MGHSEGPFRAEKGAGVWPLTGYCGSGRGAQEDEDEITEGSGKG